jgi:predicted TIM-barrel fold metal-dependent hydrolase
MRLTRRRLLLAGGAVAAGAAGYRLLRGFEDPPDEDYSATIPPELVARALDIHVHVVGVGTGGSGCWMHPQTRRSIPARAGLWSYRLSLDDPELDQRYVHYLLARVRSAGFLRHVVVLAKDWHHTDAGLAVPEHSPYFVPNDYVARLAGAAPELLFGASIHPYRPAALGAPARPAAAGAVLVKWLPNTQNIDPRDRRARAFCRRLAELGMPLVTHTGDEHATFATRQELGDPALLAPLLEDGATVIAAHSASAGATGDESNFERLVAMFSRWPNLYADTSALTLVTRWRTLLDLARRPELHARLVHGSDFPLPPAAMMFFGRIGLADWWRAWRRENPFRRDFEIKRALGLPAEVFTRGYQLLAARLPTAAPV